MPSACETIQPPAAETAAIACPVCGAYDHSLLHSVQRADIHCCAGCGFVFAAACRDAESEDGYYETLGGYEQFIAAKQPEWRRLFRDLMHHAPDKRLLEVGCARGYALALARRMGWLPSGVEVSAGDVAFARSRFGLIVHHGTVETCPFEPGSFGAVTMWSVIEHIADPISALRACHALLRPGGAISVHTCNAGSTVAEELGGRWSMFNLHGHLSFFTAETLAGAVEQAGFSIIECKTGLGSRPVDIDPAARSRPSLRKVLANTASAMGVKEPIRRMIYALSPAARGKGEFVALLAVKR